jgi:hypothetical protein
VGAGDIAECSPGGDSDTADVVESVEGIVFTLGDNAYERGRFDEFQECYGSTWGRPSIKERTRPVVGNHEYETSGAEGYFRYFGAAAGDPDEGWYAYDLGGIAVWFARASGDTNTLSVLGWATPDFIVGQATMSAGSKSWFFFRWFSRSLYFFYGTAADVVTIN